MPPDDAGRPAPAPEPAHPPAHPPTAAPVRRDYEGPGIVVQWAAERCIHTGRCIAAQPGVFDPRRRPWVDLSAADADAVARAVERCPTGALSYTRTDGGPAEDVPELVTLRVTRDGPIAIHGLARVAGERVGELDAPRAAVGRFALCRCGRTGHAPYCDNSHRALAPGWGARPGPAGPPPAA